MKGFVVRNHRLVPAKRVQKMADFFRPDTLDPGRSLPLVDSMGECAGPLLVSTMNSFLRALLLTIMSFGLTAN